MLVNIFCKYLEMNKLTEMNKLDEISFDELNIFFLIILLYFVHNTLFNIYFIIHIFNSLLHVYIKRCTFITYKNSNNVNNLIF